MTFPSCPTVPEGAPHFLLVGACKAGTTTLYDDLSVHPDAGMRRDKEPDILHKAQDPKSALALWRAHFSGLDPRLIRGEGSTYYTMLPDFPDVSQLARQVLGPEARIVYIMRHPIRRIESHLAHDYAAGRLLDTNFDRAALEHGRYVAWSDYARQMLPWIEAFGRNNVLPVIFEEFAAARHDTAKAVANFVGLDPARLPLREEISNTRGSQRIARTATLAAFANSPFYRRFIHPRLPDTVRKAARGALTKGRLPPAVRLSSETVAELERRLGHVTTDLRALGITTDRWGRSL